MTKSIIILIAYFGKFPEWMDLFVESCKFNPDIDWLITTDCSLPENIAPNVHYERTSFDQYVKRISQTLDISFQPAEPYKLCDVKPAYALIHQKDISGYDFYGYGDIDLVYGNLGWFLGEKLLDRYNILSFHADRLSSHFILFRNCGRNIYAFKRIRKWKLLMEHPEFQNVDTGRFDSTFFHRYPYCGARLNTKLSSLYRKLIKAHFAEQFSTPLCGIPWRDGTVFDDQPDTWYWKNGCLTNSRDGELQFMYLHFMKFCSTRWQQPGATASWQKLNCIVNGKLSNLQSGFLINRNGIFPLS